MKRIFKIDSERANFHAFRAVQDLPGDKIWTVTIEPENKKRSNGQNSLQWASMLGDFSIQGIINGKQFSAAVWHEYLKGMFLPDYFTDGETAKNYIKWQEMPDGDLKMIGSTTRLTTAGFNNYMEKCFSYGAQELEIKFTARHGDYR